MILVKRRTLPSVHGFAVEQHGDGNYKVSGSLLSKSEYCHTLYVNMKELTSHVPRDERRSWPYSMILHRPNSTVLHAVVTVIASMHTALMGQRPEQGIGHSIVCVYDQFENQDQAANFRLRRNGTSLCYAI